MILISLTVKLSTAWHTNYHTEGFLLHKTKHCIFRRFQVIQDILKLVYDIKPELHVNYRFD